MKKAKGFKSGKKKEPKKIKVIEAAADSNAARNSEDKLHQTTLLIPTVQKHKIKNRFFDLTHSIVPS